MINFTEKLIARYLAGETTAEEEQQLARLLSKNDIAEEWKPIRVMLGKLAMDEAIYDQIMEQRQEVKPKRRLMYVATKIAAAAAILLLIGTTYLWHQNNNRVTKAKLTQNINLKHTIDSTRNRTVYIKSKKMPTTIKTKNTAAPFEEKVSKKGKHTVAPPAMQTVEDEESAREWMENVEREIDEIIAQLASLDEEYMEKTAVEQKRTSNREHILEMLMLEEKAKQMIQEEIASRVIYL